MSKTRGRPAPEWFKYLGDLQDKRLYTTGELAERSGGGNRAITAAFKRRGLKPVRRAAGECQDNMWLGGAVKEAVLPPIKQERLF